MPDAGNPAMGAPASPMGSPMVSPMPKEGQKAVALALVHKATQILDLALAILGSSSHEGSDVRRALDSLAKVAKVDVASISTPANDGLLKMMMARQQQQGASPMPPGAPAGAPPM